MMKRIVPALLLGLTVLAPLPGLARDGDQKTCADAAAHPETALRACQRLIDRGGLDTPETARVWFNFGSANVALDRMTPALRAFDEAARRDPRLQPVYPARAWVLERLGRVDDALADYGRGIAMAPDDAVSLIGRGNLLLRRGDPAGALRDFDAVVQRDREDADALFNRGLAFAALGRTEDAVRDFTAVLTLQPNDVQALLERGLARAKAAPDAALADMTEALKRKPEWAEAFVARGRLHDAAGRKAAADRDFLRAFELGYQAKWLTERVAALRKP